MQRAVGDPHRRSDESSRTREKVREREGENGRMNECKKNNYEQRSTD